MLRLSDSHEPPVDHHSGNPKSVTPGSPISVKKVKFSCLTTDSENRIILLLISYSILNP